jgi:hypothetical protein
VELSEDRRYDSTILTIKGNTSEQQESSPQAGTGKAEGQAAGDQGEGGKAMAKRARSFAVSLRLPEVSGSVWWRGLPHTCGVGGEWHVALRNSWQSIPKGRHSGSQHLLSS